MYAKSGDASKAITMFTELRMWEEAKAFAAESGTGDVADLVQRQANWAAEVHDWRAAAEMYAASGNFNKAIDIIGERKWYGELMELARKLDAREYASALRACARYLVQGAQYRDCREVYLKLGDVESLMKLHMDLQEWEEAVTLAKQNPGRFSWIFIASDARIFTYLHNMNIIHIFSKIHIFDMFTYSAIFTYSRSICQRVVFTLCGMAFGSRSI